MIFLSVLFFFFFFNDTATTEIYTLSLHDALPILPRLSDRHYRDGSDGPRLHPGAKVRRRGGDPGGGQAAGCRERCRLLSADAGKCRAGPVSRRDHRQRRPLSPPGYSRFGGVRGILGALLGVAAGGTALCWPAGGAGRGRQFRWAGCRLSGG